MKKVGLLYDDIFLANETPEWHPECKERLIAIIDAPPALSDRPNVIYIKTANQLRGWVK